MWYHSNRPAPVKNPSPKPRWTMRIMIVLGVLSGGLFLWVVLNPNYIGYPPLYYPLVFALVFMVARTFYEWYNYWSITVPETPELKQDYKVDILTTFVPGEPYDMLIQTLEAIQKIEYPHTTHLCDEGDDPYLKAECERLGVVHHTRTEKINAKAGNINSALKDCDGDIVLILDPDHIPAPDFFKWVLPHFQNPEIGFVQVVQSYYNVFDNIVAKASAQQTFQFYGPIMMSMHHYGTAQAIGANCTFRRAALDSIGGHAAGLAEDMNTSLKLHAKGWKSVYVPRVLTKGLVPDTLSAYYKQQLKWSRGVWEIFVTTFIENFSKLSFRQRMHYGIAPIHYFSGIIYLINFLIPIISLFLGVIPMKVGLSYFLLMGVPFFASTLLVRQYAQKWVMDYKERGLHFQGGLMLIGTWWIHSLGFIFTLLRRKVPYNPTPKDGKEENILGLSVPNIAMGALTVSAIVYGLTYDFNPYSLIMSGFAALNLFFILMMMYIGFQNKIRALKAEYQWLDQLAIAIWRVKDWTWRLRRSGYKGLSYLAFPLFILVFARLYLWAFDTDIQDIPLPDYQEPSKQFLVSYAGEVEGANMQVLSFTDLSSFVRDESRHQHHAERIQFLSWELADTLNWQQKVEACQAVLEGKYDADLFQFAKHLRQWNYPVYFSFWPRIDEGADQQSSAQQLKLAALYRKAWEYIHQWLLAADFRGLMTVYEAEQPRLARLFAPQFSRLDWLKISEHSLERFKDTVEWNDYYPYNQSLPIMLADASPANIDTSIFRGFINLKQELAGLPFLQNRALANLSSNQQAQQDSSIFTDLEGTNYYKGSQWRSTANPLLRSELQADLREIKMLGLKVIKRYGPSIYDFNLIRECEEEGVSIIYAFAPNRKKEENLSLSTHWGDYQAKVLGGVERLADEPVIKAWHLGESWWNQLGGSYYKPELLFERDRFLQKLDSLSRAIRSIDPKRPISMELDLNPGFEEVVKLIAKQAPEIDAVGLNIYRELITNEDSLWQVIDALPLAVFINHWPLKQADSYLNWPGGKLYPDWQDDVYGEFVSFNGIKTINGAKKEIYHQLWASNDIDLPDVEIIAPALYMIPGNYRRFSAMEEYEPGKWGLLQERDSVTYNWYLVKTDAYKNPIAIKALEGDQASITFKIPREPHLYFLRLEYQCRDLVKIADAPLLTPVYEGPYLQEVSRDEVEARLRK